MIYKIKQSIITLVKSRFSYVDLLLFLAVFNYKINTIEMYIREVTSTERVYKIVDFKVTKSNYQAKIVVPELYKDQFMYIQFWFKNGLRPDEKNKPFYTNEFGIGRQIGKSYWHVLLFNTDGNYGTGWFCNKLVNWSMPMSEKRTITESEMEDRLYLNVGEIVEITISIYYNGIGLWINGDFKGIIKTCERFSDAQFGFETGLNFNLNGVQLKSLIAW
uniref:P5 n=1 Tax=Emaravirus camelliae TaxID=2843907 RepID=A0A8B0RBS6_9VIRU|nr:hypothetical protein [Emaravirus camelliae]